MTQAQDLRRYDHRTSASSIATYLCSHGGHIIEEVREEQLCWHAGRHPYASVTPIGQPNPHLFSFGLPSPPLLMSRGAVP